MVAIIKQQKQLSNLSQTRYKNTLEAFSLNTPGHEVFGLLF